MLLNLSNHPSTQWGPEQLAAAATYGKVVDFPFPQVPPEADTKAIVNMARALTHELMDKYAPQTITVHIMGEQTLTLTLVAMLQQAGFRCLAATTSREVRMEGQTKTAVFKFLRFRTYPELATLV